MSAIPTNAFKGAVRQAAEAIDAHFGKTTNREITEVDLAEAKELVDQLEMGVKEVDGWHPDDLSVLRRKFSELNDAFNAVESAKKPTPARFKNVVVDTLADPKIRQTARVLATRTRPERQEVSITDIIHTRAYLREREAGETRLATKDPGLAAKIEAGLKDGSFDLDAFQTLAVFMNTGNGGLASHGPFKINNHVFDDVYWLPRDILDDDGEAKPRRPRQAAAATAVADTEATPASTRARPTGAAVADDADEADAPDQGGDEPSDGARQPRATTPAKSRTDTELMQIIEAYEQRFARSGYDRVYMKATDGRLFVALNEKGSVDDIGDGDKASIGEDDYHVSDVGSATVMRVVETNNSLSDATVGFWGKLIGKLGSTIRNLLTRRIDQRLDATAGRVTSATKDRLDQAQQDNLRNMLVSGGTIATLGAALGSAGAALGQFPLVAGAVIGTGAVLTAVNTIDYLTLTRDKTSIMHAAGLTVGEGGPIIN